MNHVLYPSIDSPVVYVVDDDDIDRELVANVLRAQGIRVCTYATADSFLGTFSPQQAGCLVLDILMPGMSGNELQSHLLDHQIKLPIIFLSGIVNVAVATQAMRLGAIEVFEKPVSSERLLSSVREAFAMATTTTQTDAIKKEVEVAIRSLSEKDRIVLRHLLDGFTMKQIADLCGCSIATVARCQSRILDKLGAPNVAQLVIKLYRSDARVFDHDYLELCGKQTFSSKA